MKKVAVLVVIIACCTPAPAHAGSVERAFEIQGHYAHVWKEVRALISEASLCPGFTYKLTSDNYSKGDLRAEGKVKGVCSSGVKFALKKSENGNVRVLMKVGLTYQTDAVFLSESFGVFNHRVDYSGDLAQAFERALLFRMNRRTDPAGDEAHAVVSALPQEVFVGEPVDVEYRILTDRHLYFWEIPDQLRFEGEIVFLTPSGSEVRRKILEEKRAFFSFKAGMFRKKLTVLEVEPRGAADGALKVWDHLLAVDGEFIENEIQLNRVLMKKNPLKTTIFTVNRRGRAVNVSIVPDRYSRPWLRYSARREAIGFGGAEFYFDESLKRIRLESDWQDGDAVLKKGDIVESIEGEPLSSGNDFRLWRNMLKHRSYRLGIKRGDERLEVLFSTSKEPVHIRGEVTVAMEKKKAQKQWINYRYDSFLVHGYRLHFDRPGTYEARQGTIIIYSSRWGFLVPYEVEIEKFTVKVKEPEHEPSRQDVEAIDAASSSR